MLGEIKLVLKSNFESLPLFEPSFTQFTPYEQEDLALKVWGRNQIFFITIQVCQTQWDHFQYTLYAFDDAFIHVTHYTQWNLSVYYDLFQVV